MIRNPPALLSVFVALVAANTVSAQSVYYSENLDAGIPAGFVVSNNNGSAAVGWLPESGNFATPGVEHEDEYGVGQADYDLDTDNFDLSAATSAYLHFESMTHWANFQANHPYSLGNGVSAIEVSTDGGLSWSAGLWVDSQTQSGVRADVVIDLGAYLGSSQTMLRFHYEGDYAHNWVIDSLQVDDDSSIPVYPGADWSFVVLPSTFVSAIGFVEDFDSNPGIVKAHMAITEVDANTLLSDPDSSCNIGQNGVHIGNAFSGAHFAEMSKRPTSTSQHPTRNALVFGLQGGTGAVLDFQLYEGSDEPDMFDGVWVSDDGIEWYRLHDGESNTNSWVAQTGLALDGTPAEVSGDFFLMFAQEDNFPWPTDGIGYDDIEVRTLPPPGPYLAVQGLCGVPGGGTVLFTGGAPNTAVALVWSTTAGSYAVPAGSFTCVGALFGLDMPNVAKIGPTDANGERIFSAGGIPANACGIVLLQALESSSCIVSNILTL